jgi:hypothetical protein
VNPTTTNPADDRGAARVVHPSFPVHPNTNQEGRAMERRAFVVRRLDDAALAVRALRAGGWRLESFRTASADALPPRPVMFPQEPRLRKGEVVVVLDCVRDGHA